MDDAHLLDEGGLAGLAAAQQQDPVLHVALLLLIFQVCREENILDTFHGFERLYESRLEGLVQFFLL